MKRLQCFQHVPFEDLSNIEIWAKEKGYQISYTRLYAGETPPKPLAYDFLAIMGGPMNIYEEHLYPWLSIEKKAIEESLSENKNILGVCLGAQLIADVLGAKVSKNKEREIGWFELSLTEEGRSSNIFSPLGSSFLGFHWHGDTFSIPKSATHIAYSKACENQAFVYNGNVVGIQFHFDYSYEALEKMLKHCRNELSSGAFVQEENEILEKEKASILKKNLYTFLNSFYNSFR